jgi:hypothetical protein
MLDHLFISMTLFLAGFAGYSGFQHLTLARPGPQGRLYLLYAVIALLISLLGPVNALLFQSPP